MQLFIATNCSGTKTAQADSTLCARNLPKAGVETLAEIWHSRCQSADSRFFASQLYGGRAFKIALKTARRARADLFIVSGGFGLIHSEERIPAYSLTITPHPDSILSKAPQRAPFSSSEWWSRLGESRQSVRSFRSVLKRNSSSLLVLAVTNAYLRMIANELADLEAHLLERVRILGPRSTDGLPDPLSALLMPYTNQLNDPQLPVHGTEFDFAARAAAHFVDLISERRHGGSIDAHRAAVHRALATLVAPNTRIRLRVGDEELISLISRFKKKNTSRNGALRNLRDELGYACSAERFQLLWSTSE